MSPLSILAAVGNVLGAMVVGMVRLYQVTISRIMPPVCRFTPSCSQYMIDAVRKKGVFKGVLLGIWRVLRCNPLFPGGHDPVR